MLQEYLMSDYQRKFSVKNFRKESYKDTLKGSLKVTIFILSPGNRLHGRIEQNGLTLSGKDRLSMKKGKRERKER